MEVVCVKFYKGAGDVRSMKMSLPRFRERHGPSKPLALALQIGFLKLTGRTLASLELISPQFLDHLGRQVGAQRRGVPTSALERVPGRKTDFIVISMGHVHPHVMTY